MNRKVWFWLVAAVIALVALLASITVNGTSLQGAFIPPEFETNSAKGIPEVPEDAIYASADIGEFSISVCSKIGIENDNALLYFTNHDGNEAWMKVRLYDKDDNIIGESGLLRAGEYVESVQLKDISNTGDVIYIKVMCYEPETYYSEGSVILKATVM